MTHTSIFKRGFTALMAMLLCLSSFIGLGATKAYAAGEQAEIYLISFPRDGDANYNGEWGHPALNFMNGWSTGQSDVTTIRAMHSYTGTACYCIEPGIPQNTGDILTQWDENFWDNYPAGLNSTISPDQIKTHIGRIFQYGYTGTISTSWRSQNEGSENLSHLIATQLLVWETVVGERDAEFNHVSPTGCNAILDQISTAHPLYSKIMSYYNSIEASVKNHSTLPSFMSRASGSAQTFEFEWDGSQYKVVLTDENNVLGNFTFSASESGVNFSVDGNQLIVTSAEAPSETMTITAYKEAERKGVITWTDGNVGSGVQDVVTYAQTVSDPIQGFVNLKVSYGSAKIIKTSEDGIVEGLSFQITGNGVDQVVQTGPNGEIQIDNLKPGEYTITELSEDRYVPQDSKTVTVQAGQVATVEFSNILKKFTVELTKSDSEKGEAQGDATLAGAVYGLYDGEELIDTYTTDENGSFTTAEYICGPDWTIREIEPSPGYLLDETVHEVGADAGNFTIEHNTIPVGVGEDVIKGDIAIIKHTDDGSTQIETPEEGAEFQIYLKSAGSYDAADPDERDILTCDADGFAQSKKLPYGEYVVEQTKGWDGTEYMPAFTVTINEHGKTYKYLINNAEFEAYLKIVKVDAETGETIPYAGATFEIYDPDGNLVTMTTTYPEVQEHTQFVTNEEGWLITPEVLPFGEGYSIVEVEAPYGYVLNSDPVFFDVTPENAVSEDGIILVIAEKENAPQKGTITIEKTGEVFSSVEIQEGKLQDRYKPIYAESGLEGAEFEIRAAEDIVTPDGTLRYSAGEVVDTLTTSADGTATSTELYLGKYEIVETKAPYGMVLNEEPISVELEYAGQEVAVTSTSVSIYNERQKVQVMLYKDLEKDELFEIGTGDEILNVYFALYAAEDLTAADGTIIPKDGLIEIAGVQADGTLTFSADLPIGSYYVKEYSTNEHYLISEETYPVVFEYGGEDTAVVEIVVNNGDAILNEIIRGSISGIKVDENGEPLPGAVFGLFKADCTEFTEENAILTAESAEDGSFSFTEVPYGIWQIKEISTVDGYVLSDEIFEVQIDEDGQVIELGNIENKPVTGTVETTKVDKNYPENKLSGAVFQIYQDVNGNGTFDPDIDTLYGTMEEVEQGVYRLEGLPYGGYFLYEETAPDGYIKDDKYYFFEIREDGMTVEVENAAGTGFVNQPEDTETPDAPKTGDTSNIVLWLCVAGASLGAAALLITMNLKRRHKEKN